MSSFSNGTFTVSFKANKVWNLKDCYQINEFHFGKQRLFIHEVFSKDAVEMGLFQEFILFSIFTALKTAV